MLTRLRVLSTDGSAINGAQATLRNFFRLLDVMPMISLGLLFGVPELKQVMIPTALFGLIAMALNPRYQRIGDFVAGTMVVMEEKQWAHGIVSFHDPRVAQLAELLPADFEVSASLAKTLAEYVDQRRALHPERVAEIASHLGPILLRRFKLPMDTNHDLLLCALYYKAFVSDRMETGEPVAAPSVSVAAPALPTATRGSVSVRGSR